MPSPLSQVAFLFLYYFEFSCLNNPMGKEELSYFRDYAMISPIDTLSHAQMVKKFTDFYGNCGFTTMFTISSYWTLY
jgi:hypothetical protein